MKKFNIEVTQTTSRQGYYTIEAPDEDAAWILAEDIPFSDPRIKWNEFEPDMKGTPRLLNIWITEVKE